MPQYVIHIGAGKTGTSSIQSFLNKNDKALAGHGFVVPDRDLSIGGAVTGEHVWAVQQLLESGDPAQVAAKFDALDRLAHGRTVILSAENLSNLGNAALFKQALAGRSCKVLFYIRRQDEYLMSAWQQWYSKVESDLTAWLVKAFVQYGHWNTVVEEWEQVTGPGSINVRVFGKSEFVEGHLFKDFCTYAGIDWTMGDLAMDVPAENISFSDMITDLVTGAPGLFTGAHDNDFYNLVKRLTDRDFVPRKKVSLISRRTRDSILYFYRNENQILCRNHFRGRPHLFTPVDHGEYDYLEDEDMRKQQMQFLTRMVFELSKQRENGSGK